MSDRKKVDIEKTKGQAIAIFLTSYNDSDSETKEALELLLIKGEFSSTPPEENVLTEIEDLAGEMAEAGIITEEEQRSIEAVIEDTRDAVQAADDDDEDEDGEDEIPDDDDEL